MIQDDRRFFELELHQRLKNLAKNYPGMTATKNKLKIKLEGKVVADLFFQHLARVDAYLMGGMVYGGAIFDCSSAFHPPYKSNLHSSACFSFITSSEKNKRFSGDFGGVIKTPSSDRAAGVCEQIIHSLEKFYIPRMYGCVNPVSRTIIDVLTSPGNYAYPSVFIHCAMKLCSDKVSPEQLKAAISSKEIIKNKDYDIPLLSAGS